MSANCRLVGMKELKWNDKKGVPWNGRIIDALHSSGFRLVNVPKACGLPSLDKGRNTGAPKPPFDWVKEAYNAAFSQMCHHNLDHRMMIVCEWAAINKGMNGLTSKIPFVAYTLIFNNLY